MDGQQTYPGRAKPFDFRKLKPIRKRDLIPNFSRAEVPLAEQFPDRGEEIHQANVELEKSRSPRFRSRRQRFFENQVIEEAETQLHDPARIRAELADAEAALERGEIDEETYEELERDLLERLHV